MRIIVTGSNGFLGARAAHYLSQRHEVLPLMGRKDVDFTNREEIGEVIKRWAPEAVLHCGAISNTALCEKMPEESFLVNVVGSENIAKACTKSGARLLFCSSDQVYTGGGIQEHEETEVLCPNNVYGRQKLEAEKRCMEICPQTVCLRLSWMYDKTAWSITEHATLLPRVLNAAQNGSKTYYSDTDRRCITWVWEVIRHLEKAIVFQPGVYNFGSPGMLTTYRAARLILRFSGLDEAFAEKEENTLQKDLTMNMQKTSAAGVKFISGEEGLRACLLEINQPEKGNL